MFSIYLQSFRSAEKDEDHFEMCLQSLVEEIMINASHLLAVEELPGETVDHPGPAKPFLKKKLGRRFCHVLSKLYIHETGGYALKTLVFTLILVNSSGTTGTL